MAKYFILVLKQAWKQGKMPIYILEEFAKHGMYFMK